MKQGLTKFFYSFPIQLLSVHLRKNQFILLIWLLLFLIINGQFAKGLGIPYLFLSPEYLDQVSFLSFFIVGLTLGGFFVAYNIACYILDGYRFPFINTITKPFSKFATNNFIIPLAFVINYIVQIINYQKNYEFAGTADLLTMILGLLLGILISTFLFHFYFWFTNIDFLDVLSIRVEKRIRKLKISRVAAFKRYKERTQKPERVDFFLDLRWKVRKVDNASIKRFALTIHDIFNHNHLNTVLAEIFIFILIIVLGFFREIPAFQIPAASSSILFLTIIIMFVGAVNYWFRSWSILFTIGLFFLINFLVSTDFFSKMHYAHGLNYEKKAVNYNLDEIAALSTPEKQEADRENTLKILGNWRAKFAKKPKLVLLTASGGGQRAAYWTFLALQQLDSATKNELFRHVSTISGASGGLIGAAYYRELKFQQKYDPTIEAQDHQYLDNLGKEILNPIIFSLLTNDVFFRLQSFEYNGHKYPKDRGYAFERKLSKNTKEILNKPLKAYKNPEFEAEIPLLLLAPTSVNDGRKLYVSPHSHSYMSELLIEDDSLRDMLAHRSLDFRRMFGQHDADELSFLTALRMSASFPYITPNVKLPSDPPLELMDAGLADNFGISDAILFLYNFRSWIEENTSGVILLSIRDSKKIAKIEAKENLTVVEKLFTPIANIYKNWANVQDVRNDLLIQYANSWFDGPFDHLIFSYDADMRFSDPSEEDLQHIEERASLNWRLTRREKLGIEAAIQSDHNQKNMERLKNLLQ